MKREFKLIAITIFAAWMITFTGCKKDPEIPDLATTVVSSITATHAVTGGIVTSDGGAEVTVTGVCWDTSENPTTTNKKTSDGFGTGAFYSSLLQLAPDTKYYVRAYAINKAGTGYGNQVTFTTNHIGVATLATATVTKITEASAFSGGRIINNAEGTITAWGVCWGTTANPTTNNSKTTDTELDGLMSYESYINELQPSTNYYLRAYATNSTGTAYGNEVIFTTLAIDTITANPD